jgi:hypothetical protein
MSSPAHTMAPDESMGGDAKRPMEEEEGRPSGAAGGAGRSTLGPDGASGKSLMPPLPKNLSPAAAWKDVCEMARAMARGTDEVGFKRACDVLSEEEFLRARLTRVSNLIGFCHPPTCPFSRCALQRFSPHVDSDQCAVVCGFLVLACMVPWGGACMLARLAPASYLDPESLPLSRHIPLRVGAP